MKNNIQIAIIHVFITTLLIVGCKSNSRHPDFEVIDFNPTKNYSDSIIHIDFENTIQNGICIPSIRQTKNGEFEFEFSIKNSGKKQKFYYKLYYQNESYKYPDEHPLADGNFYGSWEDTDKTFAETPEIDDDGEPHLITDKFRIVGNPLNDTAYFGIATQEIDSVQVKQIMDQIKSTPEWFNSIKQKAKQNQIPLERQLTLDATYVVSEKNPPRRQNNRWKRNPRIGDYSFMLVVCTSDALNKIPAYIKNIGLKNGQKYVSPYYYFLFGKGSLHKNISTAIVQKKLKAIANYDFTKGIYINPENFEKINYSKTAYSSNCNESSVLQKNAQVEQFIHEIDPNSNFDNIATTADITGNAYNLSDYNANLKKPNNIKVPIKTTTCPCSTVKIDSLSKGILIKNPASETTKFTKENVGIITRHGFTYGKFRVKVKLTELLNKYQLWNGLTNAIWLYRQKGEWNQRNLCYEQGGYIPKNQQEFTP